VKRFWATIPHQVSPAAKGLVPDPVLDGASGQGQALLFIVALLFSPRVLLVIGVQMVAIACFRSLRGVDYFHSSFFLIVSQLHC
jgi:hypothetical protein